MNSREEYNDYPIFKGLQKPLEFMGLQGRYIYWAAATGGGALLGFMIIYTIFGFLIGLLFAVIVMCSGTVLIFAKQRKGLHTKKEPHGVFIYARGKSL